MAIPRGPRIGKNATIASVIGAEVKRHLLGGERYRRSSSHSSLLSLFSAPLSRPQDYVRQYRSSNFDNENLERSSSQMDTQFRQVLNQVNTPVQPFVRANTGDSTLDNYLNTYLLPSLSNRFDKIQGELSSGLNILATNITKQSRRTDRLQERTRTIQRQIGDISYEMERMNRSWSNLFTRSKDPKLNKEETKKEQPKEDYERVKSGNILDSLVTALEVGSAYTLSRLAGGLISFIGRFPLLTGAILGYELVKHKDEIIKILRDTGVFVSQEKFDQSQEKSAKESIEGNKKYFDDVKKTIQDAAKQVGQQRDKVINDYIEKQKERNKNRRRDQNDEIEQHEDFLKRRKDNRPTVQDMNKRIEEERLNKLNKKIPSSIPLPELHYQIQELIDKKKGRRQEDPYLAQQFRKAGIPYPRNDDKDASIHYGIPPGWQDSGMTRSIEEPQPLQREKTIQVLERISLMGPDEIRLKSQQTVKIETNVLDLDFSVLKLSASAANAFRNLGIGQGSNRTGSSNRMMGQPTTGFSSPTNDAYTKQFGGEFSSGGFNTIGTLSDPSAMVHPGDFSTRQHGGLSGGTGGMDPGMSTRSRTSPQRNIRYGGSYTPGSYSPDIIGSRAKAEQAVYNSFRKIGYTDFGAKRMVAEVGRESDFKGMFTSENEPDPGHHGQINFGMFNTTGKRSQALKEELSQNGLIDSNGNAIPSQHSLDVMAQFYDNDMRTNATGWKRGTGLPSAQDIPTLFRDPSYNDITDAHRRTADYIQWQHPEIFGGKYFNSPVAGITHYNRMLGNFSEYDKNINPNNINNEPLTNSPNIRTRSIDPEQLKQQSYPSIPGHIGGTLEIGGKTYPWGSGGVGRGSIPSGDYPITPGTVGPWGTAHGALGINNNRIWDSRLKDFREGIELHSGSSDALITEGCVAIAGPRWKEFKEQVLEMIHQNGSAYLHVGTDGKANVYPNLNNAIEQHKELKTEPNPSDSSQPAIKNTPSYKWNEPGFSQQTKSSGIKFRGINTSNPKTYGSIVNKTIDPHNLDYYGTSKMSLNSKYPQSLITGVPEQEGYISPTMLRPGSAIKKPVYSTWDDPGARVPKLSKQESPSSKTTITERSQQQKHHDRLSTERSQKINKPVTNFESESPTPGSDGYGSKKADPDGGSICSL